jgi:hypothetical protein
VQAAGHEGFREARHPLGLTQRQAAGRFTRDEADDLITRLQAMDDTAQPVDSNDMPRLAASQKVLQVMPADQLAIELERRGWTVIPP